MSENLTQVFVFTINKTPITWCTKKQTCVTLSFTKLKYWTLVEATKETICTRNLYKELGFIKFGTINLYCDNDSTIKISHNPMYHSKMKHFEYICILFEIW
jgi:hypothetical protein